MLRNTNNPSRSFAASLRGVLGEVGRKVLYNPANSSIKPLRQLTEETPESTPGPLPTSFPPSAIIPLAATSRTLFEKREDGYTALEKAAEVVDATVAAEKRDIDNCSDSNTLVTEDESINLSLSRVDGDDDGDGVDSAQTTALPLADDSYVELVGGVASA